MKKGFSFILFSLAMMLGLLTGMSQTVMAYDENPYEDYVNEMDVVTFNNFSWNIIEDNSTSPTSGTVTLLARGEDFGLASEPTTDQPTPSQSETKPAANETKNEPASEPATEKPVPPQTETEPATDKPKTDEKTSAQIALNSKFRVYNTGNKVIVRYGQVRGADEYLIYVSYCGEKIKKVGKTSKTQFSFSKINKKKLDLTKCIIVSVTAQQNGKQLAKTRMAHVALRKNANTTNVKQLTLSRNSIRLKKGKTKKIDVGVVLENGRKKEISAISHHCERFTYATSDKSVATVSKKGKIKAVGKGNCYIWIYAMNGTAKKLKVTVY